MAKIIIKFPYMLKPGPRMEKANAIQKSLEKDNIVVLDSSVEVTVIRDGDDILIDPRSKGEWKKDLLGHTCSNCGWTLVTDAIYLDEMHYCPNCGADMRGEKE